MQGKQIEEEPFQKKNGSLRIPINFWNLESFLLVLVKYSWKKAFSKILSSFFNKCWDTERLILWDVKVNFKFIIDLHIILFSLYSKFISSSYIKINCDNKKEPLNKSFKTLTTRKSMWRHLPSLRTLKLRKELSISGSQTILITFLFQEHGTERSTIFTPWSVAKENAPINKAGSRDDAVANISAHSAGIYTNHV